MSKANHRAKAMYPRKSPFQGHRGKLLDIFPQEICTQGYRAFYEAKMEPCNQHCCTSSVHGNGRQVGAPG